MRTERKHAKDFRWFDPVFSTAPGLGRPLDPPKPAPGPATLRRDLHLLLVSCAGIAAYSGVEALGSLGLLILLKVRLVVAAALAIMMEKLGRPPRIVLTKLCTEAMPDIVSRRE